MTELARMTNRNAVINIGWRGSTLAGKLLFIVVLARFLEPEKVGVYGLLVSVVALSMFLLGFEFFRYNMRVLVPELPEDRLAHVRDQWIFHGLLALVVLPLLLGVFALGVLPLRYIGWFYLLLILDATSREGSNLLITLSRSDLANFVLFLRAGSWIFFLLAYWFLTDRTPDLGAVCVAWSLGSAASVVAAATALAKLLRTAKKLSPVDWRWISKGASVSFRFLFLIFAIQGFVHAPRLFLQQLEGEAAVGIYTFYAGLTGPVQAFVEAGVTAIFYPRVIAAFHGQGPESYATLMWKMLQRTLLLLLMLIGLSSIGIWIVLDLVGTEVYRQHLQGYWLLLAASAVMALSWQPQLDLYVRGKDLAIVFCAILSLGVGVGLYYLWIPRYGVTGAALATLTAASTLLLSQIAVCVTSAIRNRTAPDRASA